jgi:hypothetical protein
MLLFAFFTIEKDILVTCLLKETDKKLQTKNKRK